MSLSADSSRQHARRRRHLRSYFITAAAHAAPIHALDPSSAALAAPIHPRLTRLPISRPPPGRIHPSILIKTGIHQGGIHLPRPFIPVTPTHPRHTPSPLSHPSARPRSSAQVMLIEPGHHLPRSYPSLMLIQPGHTHPPTAYSSSSSLPLTHAIRTVLLTPTIYSSLLLHPSI